MLAKNFKYYIKIFGCQMNYADAERITVTLAASGGKSTDDLDKAKLIVVLSCGVRHGAEERIIHWVKSTKKKHKKAEIILTGCLSHRRDVKERLKNCLKSAITIEKWLDYWHTERKLLKENPNSVGCFYEQAPLVRPGYKKYIPIMTGCNNFCAYCVVPFARGREISRLPESILREVLNAIKLGTKEIHLLGQNVASYRGVDKKGRIWTFARLLQKIDGMPGKFWIRFISSHPKDINEEFIKAFAKGEKVSPNLHLPIQSGSSRILAKMNRKYTKLDYLAKIKKVLEARPDTVLSSDIIVGFPGETAKDFQDSVDVVKKSQFEMLYALKYSPRPETAASKLRDSVSPDVKKERQQFLDQTWKKIAVKKNQRFLGQNVTILIDKIKIKQDQKGKNIYYAVGKNFQNKDVSALTNKNKNLVGKWGIAKITKAEALGLTGKLIETTR